MNRSTTLNLLKEHKPLLKQQFGIKQLALFGSTVRDEAIETSDIDILVSFEGVADSTRYFGLQFYLEDLFNSPVDLVTDKALRAELRDFIEQEAIYV